MVNFKDILDLTWVNVILASVVGLIIAALGVNAFYFYKKSRDTDNKMSNRWNTILLWVNIGCVGLLTILILYFFWKIFSNVVGTRPLTDIFDSFQKILTTKLASKPAPVMISSTPIVVPKIVPVKIAVSKPTVKYTPVPNSEL